MKTIVIGLGNPILGDDGIGWRVAEQVEKELQESIIVNSNQANNGQSAPGSIEINYLAVGGLTLMENLIGYDYAILIDAMNTGKAPHGTVTHLHLEDLPNIAIGHFSSAHDTTLQNAIEFGRSIGAEIPEHIEIVAIEAAQVYDFSEELSPDVAAALPKAVDTVMELLS